MRELIDILAAYDCLAREGKPAALATVVAVSGSSYRRPGARMLIAEDGRSWGGVSGGCLERDVILRARGVIAAGRAMIARYDTADDEQLASGVATGCGGTVDIFLQPITAELPGPMRFLRSVLVDRAAVTVATLIRAKGIDRDRCGTVAAAPSPDTPDFGELSRAGGDWDEDSFESADSSADQENRHPALSGSTGLAEGRVTGRGFTDSHLRNVFEQHHGVAGIVRSGDAEFFVEAIHPPQRLVVFGAGPDVIPIVQIAKTLGWHVTAIGAHPALHAAERFAAADAVMVTTTTDPLAGVTLHPHDAVLVMTHNIARDGAILAAIAAALATRPRYLGVLGPRHRSAPLIESLPAEIGSAVVSPIGLDLGAETPQEIGLSVIAEIQSVLKAATALPLSDKPGPIHDRPTADAATPRRAIACPL